MSKDLSFLKENKLFNWLLSCLTLIVLGITEYFFYYAYVQWIIWQVALLVIADVLLIGTFSVWLSVTLLPKPTAKKVIVFSVVYTVVVALLCFGSTTIYHAVNSNAHVSYLLGIGIADIIVIVSFIYAWASTAHKGPKQALIATVAVACALFVLLGAYVGSIPSSDPMKNVVKEFRVMDNLPQGNGKEVKVILLNGQSNASGVSRVSYLTEEQKTYYGKGFENVYVNYFCDNGNNSSSGFFANGGLNQGYNYGFFGPELGMAEKLNDVEGIDFIILKYTWGGTVLNTQWFAPKADGSVGPLYTAFINFTTTYMDYLADKGYNAKIGAMCWMQGESDSGNEQWTLNYLQNTEAFVSSLRRDLAGYTDEGGIRYIDAGISDSELWPRYERINNAKKQYSSVAANNAVYIDTIAAGLDFRKEPVESPDLAHYDAASEIRLGHLFAQEILKRYNK